MTWASVVARASRWWANANPGCAVKGPFSAGIRRLGEDAVGDQSFGGAEPETHRQLGSLPDLFVPSGLEEPQQFAADFAEKPDVNGTELDRGLLDEGRQRSDRRVLVSNWLAFEEQVDEVWTGYIGQRHSDRRNATCSCGCELHVRDVLSALVLGALADLA